jgi:hypothetical protein
MGVHSELPLGAKVLERHGVSRETLASMSYAEAAAALGLSRRGRANSDQRRAARRAARFDGGLVSGYVPDEKSIRVARPGPRLTDGKDHPVTHRRVVAGKLVPVVDGVALTEEELARRAARSPEHHPENRVGAVAARELGEAHE